MFLDRQSERCLVKAPAQHTSESVRVGSELWCTCVQTDKEGHRPRNEREMCSCWEPNNRNDLKNEIVDGMTTEATQK